MLLCVCASVIVFNMIDLKGFKGSRSVYWGQLGQVGSSRLSAVTWGLAGWSRVVKGNVVQWWSKEGKG